MNFLEYFSNISLIKNTSKKGIHFEQKITPDLLWCVCQVLQQLTLDNKNLVFTDRDVRNSTIFNNLMIDYFSKPYQSENTENEYNKISSYHLGFLVYCDVIEEVSTSPKNYRIKNFHIIKELATHELTSLNFLIAFVNKFIADNGLYSFFKDYSLNQSQDNYIKAKDAYWNWAKKNTKVRTNKPIHSNRVFNKIFNIFAYGNSLRGQSGAKISERKCPYNYLIYKRINFRDELMPRGISRKEFIELEDIVTSLEQKERQIKKEVREKHPDGEVQNINLGYVNNNIFNCHHILPKNEFRSFIAYRENIIILTPEQHYSFAHNRGTSSINKEFQIQCLLYKLQSIEKSIINIETFYNLENFIEMIDSLFKVNFKKNKDIKEIKNFLNSKL